MNKKVYQNINLTCVFQNTHPNLVNIGTSETVETSGTSTKVVSGMLSPSKDGGILFQETMPRKRDIRNNRLYEGQLVNIVRRKDGLYYPFMKAFNPDEVKDKSEFAFRVYQEITEALNSID